MGEYVITMGSQLGTAEFKIHPHFSCSLHEERSLLFPPLPEFFLDLTEIFLGCRAFCLPSLARSGSARGDFPSKVPWGKNVPHVQSSCCPSVSLVSCIVFELWENRNQSEVVSPLGERCFPPTSSLVALGEAGRFSPFPDRLTWDESNGRTLWLWRTSLKVFHSS